MTFYLKHSSLSSKGDGADTSQVQPSDWNAEHTVTMNTEKLVGRTTAGTGALEEIGLGTGISMASSVVGLDMATDAEVTAGTSTVKAVTSKQVKNKLDAEVTKGYYTPTYTAYDKVSSVSAYGGLYWVKIKNFYRFYGSCYIATSVAGGKTDATIRFTLPTANTISVHSWAGGTMMSNNTAGEASIGAIWADTSANGFYGRVYMPLGTTAAYYRMYFGYYEG